MTAPKLSVSTPNGRYYYHPRRESSKPSITNIMDQKNKAGLKYWASREAANYAADNLMKLSTLTRDEAIELIRRAPFAKSDSSKVGDAVHDWIDRFIKGEFGPTGQPSDQEFLEAGFTAKHMWQTFQAFNRYYHPKFVESEFTVWSETYGYAGTADWSAYIGGSLVLGDTKTGTRIYPDTGLQLAALAKADFILDPDGTERPLPKYDKFAILHIRPTYFELPPIHNIEACFNGFLGLKASFDLEINYGDSILGYAPKVKSSTIAMEEK